jgi:hypothetical protein
MANGVQVQQTHKKKDWKPKTKQALNWGQQVHRAKMQYACRLCMRQCIAEARIPVSTMERVGVFAQTLDAKP